MQKWNVIAGPSKSRSDLCIIIIIPLQRAIVGVLIMNCLIECFLSIAILTLLLKRLFSGLYFLPTYNW